MIRSDFRADEMHPELRNMDQKLQMEMRGTSAPEVLIYTNVMDSYQRLMSLNPSTVEDVAAYLARQSVKNGRNTAVNYHKMLPLSDTFIRIPSSMGLAYSVIDHNRMMTSLKTQLHWVVDMAADVSTLSSTVEGY